jgi:hypothetical protein
LVWIIQLEFDLNYLQFQVEVCRRTADTLWQIAEPAQEPKHDSEKTLLLSISFGMLVICLLSFIMMTSHFKVTEIVIIIGCKPMSTFSSPSNQAL